MRKIADILSEWTLPVSRAALLAFLVAAAPGGVAQGSGAADLVVIRQRAENADPEAQNALGNAYTNGLLGLPTDFAQALVWYHRAAEKGFAPAQFNLGLAYELGRGVPANETAAFGHYLRAAEQGFGAALFNVGNMYATGRGVRQDLFEANIWYRQAADKGLPEAQFNLGLAYESGRGVKLDETQAALWYRKAADQGFALAQYNLGLLLEDGRGLTKDEVTAAKYYRTAAEQGLGSAQHNLGLMFYEGRGGLPKDPVQALFWFSLAVAHGVEPQTRDTVRQNLTADQVAAAQDLLAKYQAAPPGAAPVASPGPPAVLTAKESSTGRESAPTSPDRSSPTSRSLPQGQAETPRLEQARVQSVDPALVDQLRDQVSRLARQVLSLTAEKNAMEAQLATKEPEKPVAPSPEQIEQMSGQLRQAEAENRRLSRELGNLRASASGASAAIEQSRQLTARIQELEAALHEARSATVPGPSLPASSQAVQQQVLALQAEKNDLEKWVQVLESSVKSTPGKAAAEARFAELTQKLAETEEMLAVTKSALESQLKHEEKLKVENSMLTYRFQRAEELLAAQLGPQPKPAELTELKGSLMEAKQTIERLTREKDGLANVWQESQFDLKKAQEKITQLERDLAQAWKKLELSEGQARPAKLAPVLPGDQLLTRQQLDGMVKDHENTQALLEVTRQALSASHNQVAELQAEIRQLQGQLDAARSSRSQPGQVRGQVPTDQLSRLQAENEALSMRLAKAQATIDLIVKAVRGDTPAKPTGSNITDPSAGR